MPYRELSDGQILAAAGGFAFHTVQASDTATLVEAYVPLEDELAQAYVGTLDLPIPKYEKRTIDTLGAKYAHICTFTGVQEEKDEDGLYVCSFMEEYTNPQDIRTKFNLNNSDISYAFAIGNPLDNFRLFYRII